MLINALQLSNRTPLHFDICIVGAGPAGIALAEVLAESGQMVCLLESGGLEPDAQGSEMNRLETDRRHIKEFARVRAFGGTTKLWSGRWKPLDAIDFEERSWIPDSGWPISKSELTPFYDEAALRFAGPSTEQLAHLSVAFRTRALCQDGKLAPSVLWTMQSSFLDVGRRHLPQLAKSPLVHLLLETTLVRLRRNGNVVTEAECVTRERKERTIRADRYVLASGGIENARLLLLSELGGDAVGRYFMEHPKGVLGMITPASGSHAEREWLKVRAASGSYRIGLRLSDDEQQKQQLLNAYVQLEPVYSRDLVSRAFRKLGGTPPLSQIAVMSYFEQAPKLEHKVSLSKELDTFGMPRACVSWELDELDKQTMTHLHEVLGDCFKKAYMGMLQSPVLTNPEDAWRKVRDAAHHMGTTRMGSNPATSVTDANAKVHGLDNLYIAGSSLFPTSGHANPTATVIALSLRLGHHLRT